jgi:hypothetical protein
MSYVLTFLEPEWQLIAERLAASDRPVPAALLDRIQEAIAHQRHVCACPVHIELTPAEADLVLAAHAEGDLVAADMAIA